MTSAPRTATGHRWHTARGPRRPAAARGRDHHCRAERVLASKRREERADAAKTAAFTAYFLGGGRYL